MNPILRLLTRPGCWLLVSLLAFTALRLAEIPDEAMNYSGFTHDSGYICIVARNVLAGRGYVNDAHWLVFLHPEHLPVPYHNANPLYPTAVAGLAALTGRDVAWAGFAVSVLAGSLLAAALYIAAGRYVTATWQRALLAAAGLFFPSVFEDTLHILPDALCAAMLGCFLAALVWGGWKNDVAAGAFFGLAWLARSTAAAAVPAVLVFLLLQESPRGAARRGARLAAAALVVVLPWLIHTTVVWGSPLRSDASYYLWQHYHAIRHNDGNVVVYWHSPDTPPSMAEVLRNEPGELTEFYWSKLKHMPKAIGVGWFSGGQEVGAAESLDNVQAAALLGALFLAAAGLAVAKWKRERLLTPPRVAGAVYVATVILALAPRGETLEIRYFTPPSILVALFVMSGTLSAVDLVLRGRILARLVGCVLVLAAAVFWLDYVRPRDVYVAKALYTRNDWTAWQLDIARKVDAEYLHGQPVVVGHFPYYYTFATGAPSLAMPAADEAYLMRYMERYGVRHVFLLDSEMGWRWDWVQGRMSPRFRVVGRVEGGTVYELAKSP